MHPLSPAVFCISENGPHAPSHPSLKPRHHGQQLLHLLPPQYHSLLSTLHPKSTHPLLSIPTVCPLPPIPCSIYREPQALASSLV